MPATRLLTASELQSCTIYVPYNRDGKISETAIAISHDELRKKQQDPLHCMAQLQVYNPLGVDQIQNDIRKDQELRTALFEFLSNNHESAPASTPKYAPFGSLDEQYAVLDAMKEKHFPVPRIQAPPANITDPEATSTFTPTAFDHGRAGNLSTMPPRSGGPLPTSGEHPRSMPTSLLGREVIPESSLTSQARPSIASSVTRPKAHPKRIVKPARKQAVPRKRQVSPPMLPRIQTASTQIQAKSRTPSFVSAVPTYPIGTQPIDGQIWQTAEYIKKLPRNIHTGMPYRSGLKFPRFKDHFFSSSGTLKPDSTLLQYRDDWFLFTNPMWKFLEGMPNQIGPIAGCYRGDKGWDTEMGDGMREETE